jgi:hypothetical protein
VRPGEECLESRYVTRGCAFAVEEEDRGVNIRSTVAGGEEKAETRDAPHAMGL